MYKRESFNDILAQLVEVWVSYNRLFRLVRIAILMTAAAAVDWEHDTKEEQLFASNRSSPCYEYKHFSFSQKILPCQLLLEAGNLPILFYQAQLIRCTTQCCQLFFRSNFSSFKETAEPNPSKDDSFFTSANPVSQFQPFLFRC